MKKLMTLVTALAMSATLWAIPAQFTYQGVLKDTSNASITGNQTVSLKLYANATTTTALWGRKYNVFLDATGLFNVEVSDNTGTSLGYTKTLATVLAENPSLYIGLTVSDTSGEIKPRQKLLAVPYASVAADVSRASGTFSTAGKLTAASASFTGALSASSMTVSKSVSAGSVTSAGNATVSGNLTVSGAISGYGIAPIGSIIMWSGAQNEIPTGWALCDGGTYAGRTTPDLRGRFIVGAGGTGYAVGATGGADSVQLTVAQMPSHSHSYKFKGADLAGAFKKDNFFYCQKNPYGLSNTKSTNNTGGNQAHENRPPYYALCFIMRVS